MTPEQLAHEYRQIQDYERQLRPMAHRQPRSQPPIGIKASPLGVPTPYMVGGSDDPVNEGTL